MCVFIGTIAIHVFKKDKEKKANIKTLMIQHFAFYDTDIYLESSQNVSGLKSVQYVEDRKLIR